MNAKASDIKSEEKSEEIGAKAAEETAANKGKYTELELRKRGVGKFIDTQTREWAMKLSTYHDEEVKRVYLAIKRSLDLLCTNVEN